MNILVAAFLIDVVIPLEWFSAFKPNPCPRLYRSAGKKSINSFVSFGCRFDVHIFHPLMLFCSHSFLFLLRSSFYSWNYVCKISILNACIENLFLKCVRVRFMRNRLKIRYDGERICMLREQLEFSIEMCFVQLKHTHFKCHSFWRFLFVSGEIETYKL